MHITSVCRYSRHEKRAPGVRSPVWRMSGFRFEERWERAGFLRQRQLIQQKASQSALVFGSACYFISVGSMPFVFFVDMYIWLHSHIRRNIYLPFVWKIDMLSSCTCFIYAFGLSEAEGHHAGLDLVLLCCFSLSYTSCASGCGCFLKLCLKLLTLQDCQFWAQGFCPGVSAWAMALNGVVKSFNPHKASFTDSASSMND